MGFKHDPNQTHSFGITRMDKKVDEFFSIEMYKMEVEAPEEEQELIFKKEIPLEDIKVTLKDVHGVNDVVAKAGFPFVGALIELMGRNGVLDDANTGIVCWLILTGAMDGIKAEHSELNDHLADALLGDFMAMNMFEELKTLRKVGKLMSILGGSL